MSTMLQVRSVFKKVPAKKSSTVLVLLATVRAYQGDDEEHVVLCGSQGVDKDREGDVSQTSEPWGRTVQS